MFLAHFVSVLLKRVLPDAIKMIANNAVGPCLSGCALFMFGERSSSPLSLPHWAMRGVKAGKQ